MRNNHNENIPDESKIQQLLSGFKPQPSHRYIARMTTAPWQTQDYSRSSSQAKNWVLQLKPAWILASIIFVLALLTLAFIPSIRVAADQFIHFFLPAASDRLEVQVTPANPLDSLDFLNPSNFPLSISAVQQLAGFTVKEIPTSPGAPSFQGARYDPAFNAVILLYKKGEDYTLLLTQRPLGNSQDVFSIGSNAHVEFVNVGNVQGEYVVGGWNAISTETPSANPTPSGTLHISAAWDDSLPQFTLRWQESGFVYELRSNGEYSPSQSQLISWANGLK
jgi:hypothetical protein